MFNLRISVPGVHARWKWLTTVKRGIKFNLLNALLKLFDYLDFYGELPPFERVYETLALERQLLYDRLRNLDGAAHQGLRNDQINLMRFNLSPAEVNLIRDRRHARPAEQATPATAWGNYVKALFKPHLIYEFSELGHNRFLYVAENKSLPNREQRTPGEAIGRDLVVLWFCQAEEQPDDGSIVLVPAADLLKGEVELLTMTVAEIARAAGVHPPVPVAATDRDVELLH